MSSQTLAPFAALWEIYLERGWEVLPLPAGRKGPPPGGTTGRTGKPIGADVAMACADDDSDLGVRMPPGVIGLDWDDYRGEAIQLQEELEAKHGKLPDTWSSSSRAWPSRIDYYRFPAGHEDAELPGTLGCLDIIQHHHRYAKVAGTHPDTGERYRWADRDGHLTPDPSIAHDRGDLPPFVEDLPELPIGWLNLQSPKPEIDYTSLNLPIPETWRPAVLEPLAQALTALQGGHGSRHDAVNSALMSLANAAVSGYGEAPEAITQLREAWMGEMSEARGDIGALEEWDRMLSGAQAKALPITAPAPGWEETWPVTAPAVSDQTPQRGHTWSVESLLTILDEAPRDFIVENLIPVDSFTVIYGKPKSFKTFYSLDLAWTLASVPPEGGYFHGRRCKPRKVAYVYGESRSAFQARAKAWMHARSVAPERLAERFVFIPGRGHNLTDHTDARGLAERLSAEQIEYVFIDTIASLTPGMEENSSEGMGRFLAAVEAIRSLGIDVCAVHHSPKDGSTPRGHGSLLGAGDSYIHVRKADGIVTAELKETRDFEDGQETRLRPVMSEGQAAPVLEVTTEQEVDDETKAMRGIVHALRSNDGTAGTPTLLLASGLGEKRARKLLTQMAQLGWLLTTEGVGRGNPTTHTLTEKGRKEVP